MCHLPTSSVYSSTQHHTASTGSLCPLPAHPVGMFLLVLLLVMASGKGVEQKPHKGTVTSPRLAKAARGTSFRRPQLHDVWCTHSKSAWRSTSLCFAFISHWTRTSQKTQLLRRLRCMGSNVHMSHHETGCNMQGAWQSC